MEQRSGQPIWYVDAAAVAGCAIATVLAYAVVVAPLLRKQAVVAAEYQQLADQRKEASRLCNSLLALRSRTGVLEGQSAQNRISLYSTDQMNGRLAELTGLLDRCAIKVDTLKAGTPISGPVCDVVPIRVLGRGGYRQYRTFLRDLHQNLRDIRAVGFDLMADPGQSGTGGPFRLDLFWYAAKRPAS